MSHILLLFKQVFDSCVEWTSGLLEATDGLDVILSCFVIYLVVSLFIVPIRGGRIGGPFMDFMNNQIHKKKDD